MKILALSSSHIFRNILFNNSIQLSLTRVKCGSIPNVYLLSFQLTLRIHRIG